jgi:beta-galactosidase/beta-glucuronidase
MKRLTPVLAFALAGLSCACLDAAPGRLTIVLDGQWHIGEGKSPEDIPVSFNHTVPVPGLANLAQPVFADVDGFWSREYLANRIRSQLSPAEWGTNYWEGKINQDRNYFWYRRTFRAPAAREVAMLKINKAQFGTALWLNGDKVGEYPGCFSASYFHLERQIIWNAENSVLIRIGAHPAVLPDNYPAGSDFEKTKWTPGIYDSVSLIFCDNPIIEALQVAPRIATGEVVVQTRIRNYRGVPVQTALTHEVKTWKGHRKIAASSPQTITLQAGEEKLLTQSIQGPISLCGGIRHQ